MKWKPSASGPSSGSGTVSLRDGRRQDAVRIVLGGDHKLVSPISSRAASPLKERMVASWLFQPKRPTRVVVGSSSNGTMSLPACASPLTPKPRGRHRRWLPPSRSPACRWWVVGHDVGHGRQFFSAGQINARDLSKEPPYSSSSMNPSFLSSMPKRITVWLPWPPTGLLWQLAQDCLLKIGPKPLGDEGGVVELGPDLKNGRCTRHQGLKWDHLWG